MVPSSTKPVMLKAQPYIVSIRYEAGLLFPQVHLHLALVAHLKLQHKAMYVLPISVFQQIFGILTPLQNPWLLNPPCLKTCIGSFQ